MTEVIKELERVQTKFGVFYGFRGDAITSHLLVYGAHQRNELAMLLSFTRAGDVVVDVGANIGTFSIPLASCVGPEGHVYALEADNEIFDVLRRNISSNDMQNITALNAIVSRKTGRYRKIRSEGNMGATRFELEDSDAQSTAQVISIDSWFRDDESRPPRVDLIKIDVEGMDVDVLQSCVEVIERFLPIVYIEIGKPLLKKNGFRASDVEELLGGLGYHFFRNTRARNSTNDRFRISRLPSLFFGGEFFDLLAVHPDSERYPSRQSTKMFTIGWFLAATAAKAVLRGPKRLFGK